MSRQFRAAVFDLDGTLIDTEPAHLDAQSRALRALGVDPADSRRPRTFGMGIERGVKTLASAFGLDYALLRETYLRVWEVNLRCGVAPMPGANFLLDWLKDRSVPLALVTSGDRGYVKLIDQSVGIVQYFDAIVTADDVKKTKPDPEPYVRAVTELRTFPARVIGFEDSGSGVSALRGAKVYAVAVHKDVHRRAELEEAGLKLTGLDAISAPMLEERFCGGN